ncbi:DUF805 domain-containing protein [Neisseriaceae bacterium ESL0693]|nr:DUF805 domain-containing protein [Neisseriaceae bacterium ESL0693]
MLALFIDCFTKKYAQFDGRACRKEFWPFMLFNFILLATPCILIILHAKLRDSEHIKQYFIVYLFFYFVLLIPRLAVTVRRLHDRDISGWWLLLYQIPAINYVAELAIVTLPLKLISPAVGHVAELATVILPLKLISPAVGHVAELATVISLAVGCVAELFILVICCYLGTEGPNRFGDDPLDIRD